MFFSNFCNSNQNNYESKFVSMTDNHEKFYDFIVDSPNNLGLQIGHFFGCKGSGKTTTCINAIFDLFMKYPGLKGLYFKNAIKELKSIRRELISLGAKPSDEGSLRINGGTLEFGYFTTHGLNKKHGGSYDIVIVEELQICPDVEELESFCKMLARGTTYDFNLILYIYNPDPLGRKNYDLLRMQETDSNVNVQFLPEDNPILYHQKPKNYWERLGEGLSEDAYKAWILGDLHIFSDEVIFTRDTMNYVNHEFNSPVMYIDPAMAEEYNKGSLTAFTVVEEDKDGNFYFLCKAYGNHFEGAKGRILEVCKELNVAKVFIETNQGQYSLKKSLKDGIVNSGLNIQLISKHNYIPKYDRILNINLYNKKKMYFDKRTNREAHNQILRYNYKDPNLNSDTLDSIAGALMNYKKIGFNYTEL